LITTASRSPKPQLIQTDLFGTMKKSRHLVGLKVSETLYAPELTIPWHEHEKAGFCFVMEGAYEERFGRRRRDCDRGVLVLHPAGEQHADRHRNATVRLLNVEFDCNRLRAIQDVAAVLHDSLDLRGPEFMRFGLRLEREFRRSDTASDLALEALVLEVLASTARIGIDVEDQKPIWLRRVIEEIEVRPSAGHTMRSLAAKAGVHPVQFARTFRRHQGCTEGTYLRRLRVQAACLELTSGSMPLCVIAQQAGFADQSHFCRVFRAMIGTSPGIYRRERGRASRFLSF